MELRPGYKQTDVGMIPEEWRVAAIKDVASIRTGGRNTQDRVDDGAYPFFVRSQVIERINSYSFDGEAVLTAGDGVGTGKVFHYIQGRFDVHQRVYRISEFAPNVNGFFFFLYFSNRFHDRIMSMTAKSSVDSVRLEMIAGMPVPLPPPAEQHAIARALGDVDAQLGSLTRLIVKKRDLKQAAMQQLLTPPALGRAGQAGQTRLPGFHGGWDVKELREVVLDGPRNGYSGRGAPEARGTPTLRLTATTSGYLILNDETVKRLNETIEPGSDLFLQHGDLLIQRSNTPDLVGTAALFDGPSDIYVYPDLMMRLRFREESTARWIWNYANSRDGRRFFLSASAGSTGSMPKISGETLRRMVVPFPHLAEQAAIAAVLSDMDAEIAALERRLAKTRALKQAMLQELLTGKTRLV